MKTANKILALFLAALSILGLIPVEAGAADNDVIKLKDYVYTGLTYTSEALGSSDIHPMKFSYNGGAEGFCADHGKGMGTSLIGQTFGNRTAITDPSVLLLMAYYYSHTTASYTSAAISAGLNASWDGDYTYLMNAWVQAVIWRYRTGAFSDPVLAAAEELKDVYNGMKSAGAASVDDIIPGRSCSYLEFTQDIFNQGTATWGEAEAYLYAFTGSGSESHPASTVQGVIVGSVDNTHEPIQYSLTVKKVDSTNINKGLAGANFYIERVGSTQSWNVTTGADGTYTLGELKTGTYAITEVDPPAGYTIDNAGPQYVSLPSNGQSTVTVTFADTPTVSANGSIRKVDADIPSKGLAGATIAIEGVDNSFYGEYQTGAGGALEGVDWSAMPYGSYKAYEKTAPEGYILNSEVKTFSISAGNTDVHLVFTNEAKVKLRLTKTNDAGAPLSGAVFNILCDGKIVGTQATDTAGRITVTDIAEGFYSFVEVYAPAGYAKSEPVIVHVDSQRVTSGGTVEVTATDKRLPNLTISKRDKKTGTPIAGTIFSVSGIHYGYTTEVTTNSNGSVTLTGIPVDSYEVREKFVPHPYILDTSNVQTVWLEAGSSQSLVFENLKKPGLKIVKYDAQSGQTLADTTFKVYRDTVLLGEYTTGADGTVTLYDLEPGTYLVQEVATANTHVVNSTPQQIELEDATEDYTLVFRNFVKSGIHLVKLDSETLKPLVNARFRISEVGGSFSKEYLTDINGEIDLTGLTPGSYTIEEISAPDGYLIDDSVRTIRINEGENAEFVFTDTKKPSMVIVKYDTEGKSLLPGATFRIAKIEDGSHYLDRITDSNGRIEITDLEPGVYSVQEMEAPTGYVLNPTEYHVELFAGQVSELVVKNDARPALRIVKYDAQTKKPLSDTKFEVYCDTSLIGTYVTDAKGEVLLYDLNPGTYLVKEVATQDSHVVNSTPQEIVLNDGNPFTYNLVFLNYLKPGITITKLDRQTYKPLANAKFRITKIGGNYSKEFTTDANGEINIASLDEGIYTIEEISAPEGYLIDDAARTVEIKGGEHASFVFTDTVKPSLKIVKTDSLTGKTLPGASFRIARIEDGTHFLDRVTDADGEINISDLVPGVYSVVEMTAPEGYVRNLREYHVEVVPGKTAQLVVHNDNRPNLTVIKRDADTGETVADTVFIVKAADGHSVDEIKTDADGKATLANLLPGVYEITEKSVPSDYLLDAPAQLVTLYPNRDRTVYFENHKKPSLTVNKISSVSGEPLQGAKFQITYASNNTSSGEINDLGYFYTDENGQFTLNKLKDGWYKVTEIESVPGYAIKEPATQEIYIQSGAAKTLTFENTPLSALVVFKYDSVSGAAVKGAVFQVKKMSDTSGTGGTVIGTYRTTENGSFTVTGLVEGTYIVEELEAGSGYVIDSAPQTAYISGRQQDVVQLYFGNTPKGSVLVKKVDASNGKPLSDVEFLVTYADGTVVGNANGKYVTDSTGTFSISDLTPGTSLVIKETRAKSGYVLDNVAQTVTVKAGAAMSVEFRNAPNGGIIIRKFDAATKQPLSGAVFEVKTADGRYVDNFGGMVSSLGRYTTGADGQIMLYDLTPGTYVITEVAAPVGYQLSGGSKTVVVSSADAQIVDFFNPANGSLLIKKIDAATHEPLSDVQFLVTDSTGTVIGNNNGIYTTDCAGTILISNLAPGITVAAKEIKAKDGYVLDDAAQSIVTKSGETVSLEFRNYPKGALVIKKYDNITKEPLSGAEFKVTTSTGELVASNDGRASSNSIFITDENGEIVLTKLSPATYIVIETKAPTNYKLDSRSQTVRVNADDTQTVWFYDDPYCYLTIYKRDSETKKLLAGAEFSLAYSDGRSIGKFTTDKDGKFIASGLIPNATVVVTEEKAPTGYIRDAVPRNIVVKSGENNSLTFDNTPTSTLVIHKYITGTDNEPLAGVAFKVVDRKGASVGPDDGVYYTDAKGEIVLSGLEPGTTVKVQEIRTVDGFVLDGTPQDIQIEAGAVQNLTFWNTRQGSVVIRKLDSVTKKPLEGVTFEVRYSDGRVVDNNGGKISSGGIYTTNCAGEIAIYGVTGTLVITEIKALPGYAIDVGCKTQTVVVNPDDTQYLTFYNTPEGGLVITKSDEDTGARISGVKFEVRKLNGEIVGTYTTDRNGVIQLPVLEKGWYSVTELKAADGYKLDATPQTVEVKDGKTAHLDLTNTKISGIAIHKTDSVTGKGIYGVKFMVYDNAGKPVEQIVTDQNGYAYTDEALSSGRYYVRELETAEGYILDMQEKSIYVSYGHFATIEWKNTPVTGQIQIAKLAAEYNTVTGQAAGAPISGAVYEIVRERSGVVVGYITTDARGVAASAPLPLGRYIVREVTAPAYWQLSAQKFDITLEYEGQIIKVADYERPAILGVSIVKSGIKEALAGSNMLYRFTVANTSNVELESFFWHDKLPYDATTAMSLTTGTYSHRLNYRVLYKTNYNDYRVLASNLLTTSNYALPLNGLALQYGEIVTDIYFDFGTVPVGFQSKTQPTLTVNVNPSTTNGYYITNRADCGGKYAGTWETANSSRITVVRNFTAPKPLPKTGY